MSPFRDETTLAILLVWGGIVYGLAVLAFLGRKWLKSLMSEVAVVADTPAPPDLEHPDPIDDSEALPDNEPPPKA
jgi:hypothetical protein